MFNRSTIKYSLKKILPKPLFVIVLFIWQKVLISLVEAVDAIRLKRFTTQHHVTLAHKGVQFSLLISPENGFVDKHIFLYGVYEPFMLDLIKKYLHEGMTFVDIGANIGQHSMYAASLVGKRGNVYSFEPIPFIYKQLQESSRANKFETIIHAYNVALGKENKKEVLHISRNNIGASSLVHEESVSESITVQINRGDELLDSLPHINLIKIDVEGYEYEVLEGLQETLRKHTPNLLLEFSGDFYTQQHNNHGEKIIALLRKNAYSIFDIEDDMKKITDDKVFLALFPTKKKQTNLLCRVEN